MKLFSILKYLKATYKRLKTSTQILKIPLIVIFFSGIPSKTTDTLFAITYMDLAMVATSYHFKTFLG